MEPFPLLGSETDERRRLGQLSGTGEPDGVLLRAASRFGVWAIDSGRATVRLLAPQVWLVANSALPQMENDGPLHAARGMNGMLTAGVDLRFGRARLVLAPQLVAEQNLPFQVIQYPQDPTAPRSIWANPFHPLPESIDLPLRFGATSNVRVDPGQSSFVVRAGNTDVGVATENLWWGPGIRNAIILSNNAAGFPHFVVRSAAPQPTPIGPMEFDLILGRLSESPYFDQDRGNGQRSIAGGAVSWRPPGTSGVRVGLARLRIAGTTGHDQMSSLFGRWVLPAAGVEVYTEWGRSVDPSSLRDFLEYPHHSEGYTLGLQWAHALSGGRLFRLQTEASYLEPSASLRLRPLLTWYTSDRVPQGFTQRGEVLGAAIGPGSSGQWLAGDVFAPSWRLGGFVGRTRYDNGTLYESIVPGFKLQDVTLYGGIRASTVVAGVHVALELTDAVRLNYLYQSYIADPIATTSGGVDIANRTLSLIVSSAPRR